MKQAYVSKRYKNIIHIWEPLFRSNFYYIIADNIEKYHEIVKKSFKIKLAHKERDIEGNATSCVKDGNTLHFIWTKKHSPSTLAHECFHAASDDLACKGIKLTDESNEAFAYHIEFLMENILKHLPKGKS